MASTQTDTRFYRAQQTTVRETVDQAQAAWSQLETSALTDSWTLGVRPRVVDAVEQGQAQAVALAQSYVTATVMAAGSVSAPLARLVAGSWAGFAANGLPLPSLMDYAVGYLRRALALGAAPSDARALGLRHLLTYASTEVADSGRLAVQVAGTLEPEVAGYERVVHLPACARCIILTGRVYRYTEGFLRHPRCDCGMRPVTRQQWRDGNDNTPRSLFARMTPEQQDAAFGRGDAEAIRAGADMSRVVNTRRRKGSVYVAGGHEFTREATTTRGVGRQLGALHKPPGGRNRRSGVARPTPAQLVTSTRDRAELVEQLRRFGYVR